MRVGIEPLQEPGEFIVCVIASAAGKRLILNWILPRQSNVCLSHCGDRKVCSFLQSEGMRPLLAARNTPLLLCDQC